MGKIIQYPSLLSRHVFLQMVRLELFEYYNRKIGAFCSAIPAVFNFIIILVGGTLGVNQLFYTLATFGPLILAGYYFDVVFESALLKLAHYLFLRLVLSWMLLFTLPWCHLRLSFYGCVSLCD